MKIFTATEQLISQGAHPSGQRRTDEAVQQGSVSSAAQQWWGDGQQKPPPTDGCHDKPNGERPRTQVPCVDEALILQEEEIRTETRTVSRARDPLVVSGSAPEGTLIRVYNPDMPGWPLVATAVAGPDKKWQATCEDAALFARGDRVAVTAQAKGQLESSYVLKNTHAVTKTHHIHSTIHDGVLRGTQEKTTLTEHGPRADDRPPYFDGALVDRLVADDPAGGVIMKLEGQHKAVPPKTEISAYGAREPVTADDLGRFTLERAGLTPGGNLHLTLKDVNGRITRTVIDVPSRSVDIQAIAAKSAWDDTSEPAGLRIGLPSSMADDSELIVRQASSGKVSRISKRNCPSGVLTIPGVKAFEVLQFAQSLGKKRTDLIELAVAVPGGEGPALLPLAKARASAPALESALTAARTEREGSEIRLQLPQVAKLPAYGLVEIYSGKQKAGELRADAAGTTPQVYLTELAAGQQLDFITKDAAGRRLGFDVLGWTVPEAGQPYCTPTMKRRADNATLSELTCLIGTGRILPEEALRSGEVSVELNPDDWSKSTGIKESEGTERYEIMGEAAKFFPEAPKAGKWESVHLSVADWDGGTRFISLRSPDHSRVDLRLPLPVGGEAVTTLGQESLADQQLCLQLLERAASFAAMATSVGASAGDRAIEIPLAIMHSAIYALDRIAFRNPGLTEQLQEAARKAVEKVTSEPIDALRWVPAEGATIKTPRADAEAITWEPLNLGFRHPLDAQIQQPFRPTRPFFPAS